MQIKLTWDQTQDHLYFDVINFDITQWFVETGQRLGNQYSNANMATDMPRVSRDTGKLIAELSAAVDQVNKFFAARRMPIVDKPTNWLDQNQLNLLHKAWAKTRLTWPKLDTLLYKIDTELFDRYHEMNCHIHLIENSFSYEFRDPSNWRLANPYKDQFYDWETCHLALAYPGHGRVAFEKFEVLDQDPENFEQDNCNWDNIDAYVKVQLVRPFEESPPPEFLTWCQDKNVVPHRRTIPLANLTDWSSTLTQAREIFFKNTKIKDNYFSLEIIK